MDVTIVDERLKELANQKQCDLVAITKNGINDVLPLLQRVPTKVTLTGGHINTPSSRYFPEEDKLEIGLFYNLVCPVFGKKTLVERDESLQGYVNHEVFEAVSFSTANNNFKRAIHNQLSALTNILNLQFGVPAHLKKEIKELYNNKQGIEVTVDDVIRDVLTDSALLKIKEYPSRFCLGNVHYCDIDKKEYSNFDIVREKNFFASKLNPYELLGFILTSLRRKVIVRKIKAQCGQQAYYRGKLENTVDYHLSRVLRFVPLNKIVKEMKEELTSEKPNKGKMMQLCENFALLFNKRPKGVTLVDYIR